MCLSVLPECMCTKSMAYLRKPERVSDPLKNQDDTKIRKAISPSVVNGHMNVGNKPGSS